MFDLKFEGQKFRSQHCYIFVEFRDIDSVPIDTTHKFVWYIYYQRYHVECIMSCLTSNFKMKGQGHNQELFFEFLDICLVIMDTIETQVSMTYTTRDIILNALRHVQPWISRIFVRGTRG